MQCFTTVIVQFSQNVTAISCTPGYFYQGTAKHRGGKRSVFVELRHCVQLSVEVFETVSTSSQLLVPAT